MTKNLELEEKKNEIQNNNIYVYPSVEKYKNNNLVKSEKNELNEIENLLDKLNN